MNYVKEYLEDIYKQGKIIGIQDKYIAQEIKCECVFVDRTSVSFQIKRNIILQIISKRQKSHNSSCQEKKQSSPKINSFSDHQNIKEITILSLKKNFKCLKKPIIDIRLLLNLSSLYNDETMSYKQFCHFIKADNALNAILQARQTIESVQQRVYKYKQNILLINNSIDTEFQTFKKISDENDTYFDQQTFEHAFISNQMRIQNNYKIDQSLLINQ
ncbi:unnamed protein product [Paramecium pentaurelia]|uniref:Uncharacterized protein n=1 Tax=Paramecium pentaurelia TaxID=43138 RepID=A0A8S1Y2G8_9CILI|nr:unnamed protein product [Paramecium pentaurelia]